MPDRTKIFTCCYCSTRAVMRLDERRHELVCSGCGAPLHHMKPLPAPERQKQHTKPKTLHAPYPKHKKSSKKKRRKPTFSRMMEKLWDEVEDIFD